MAQPYYGVDPLYASSPTYAAPMVDGYAAGTTIVESQPQYQQVPIGGQPGMVQGDPSVNAAPQPMQAPSPPPGDESAEGLEYKPLTEPGTGTAIGEGNIAFRAGRYEEARQQFSKAILADERDGYAKMLYAVANFAAGDYGVAATAIRRSLMTTQELIDYPIDLRTMYADVMVLHAQMQTLAQYVAANPEDKDASLVLAYMHYSIGEAQPARDMFKLMAENDTSDTLLGQLHTSSNKALEYIRSQPPPQPEQDSSPAPEVPK